MILKGKELDKVYKTCLEAAKKDNNEHEVYYCFRNRKIVTINKGEIDEYLDQVDEIGEDEFLDDIIDSGEYVKLPFYNGDDEEFKRNLYFAIDYSDVAAIEADKDLLKTVLEMAYELYKLRPFDYFRDVDFIIDDPEVDGLDECYICVLGKAGKCYGLSLYFGEEGLESLCGLYKEDIAYNQNGIFSFTQECVTFYFDEPDMRLDSYYITKEALGNEISDKVMISVLQMDRGHIYRDFLRYSKCLFIRPYMESFIHFLRKYYEDEQKKPHRALKYNEHYLYHFDEDKEKITYRRQYVEEPEYCINGDFILSIPFLYDKKDIKKTSKEYELKVFSFDHSFNSEDEKRLLYYPIMAILFNHKTGEMLYSNVVLSENRDYLEELFDPMLDKIRETGYPKRVYVSTMLDYYVAKQIFIDDKVVEIAMTPQADKFLEFIESEELKEMDA